MITAMANETQMNAPDVSATVPDWSREQMKGRSLDCAANMPCFVTVYGR